MIAAMIQVSSENPWPLFRPHPPKVGEVVQVGNGNYLVISHDDLEMIKKKHFERGNEDENGLNWPLIYTTMDNSPSVPVISPWVTPSEIRVALNVREWYMDSRSEQLVYELRETIHPHNPLHEQFWRKVLEAGITA